jgi:hypothetical protein
MIDVTEQAKAALLAIKGAADVDRPKIGLRLTFGPDGALGLVPDAAKAGDEVVTHGAATVLLVDPEISAGIITGRIIDCRPAPGGQVEFFLRRRRIGEQLSSAA